MPAWGINDKWRRGELNPVLKLLMLKILFALVSNIAIRPRKRSDVGSIGGIWRHYVRGDNRNTGVHASRWQTARAPSAALKRLIEKRRRGLRRLSNRRIASLAYTWLGGAIGSRNVTNVSRAPDLRGCALVTSI